MLDADIKSQLREAQTQTEIFTILSDIRSTDLSSSDYFLLVDRWTKQVQNLA